jgi:8-oxo-dGTP pyrophosphatase MutT (NUDIX family)
MALPIIIAAGGLVLNDDNKLLMIFRRGKWDLPKGKLDAGETIEACAIREVQEETGLQQVELLHFIDITTHEYFDTYKNEQVVKESHWYAMKAYGKQHLQPQIAEDITNIGWFTKEAVYENLTNSFFTIEHIINLYYKL